MSRPTEQRRGEATVAFVDLAGFSALTDVYGDTAAIGVIDHFETLVDRALGAEAAPVKWIGDEAMLAFSDPLTAVRCLTDLLSACRADPEMPLTRTGLHHGPVIHRRRDLFGTTVNIASRLTALARPGQVLSTAGPAGAAATFGHQVHRVGPVTLRSVSTPVELHALELADPTLVDAIDPVCKMHAPPAQAPTDRGGPWFCSPRCAQAYAAAPTTYR